MSSAMWRFTNDMLPFSFFCSLNFSFFIVVFILCDYYPLFCPVLVGYRTIKRGANRMSPRVIVV